MTRPFSVIGFSYLIILMMLSFIGICIPGFVSIALIVLLIATLFSKNLRNTKIIPCVIFVAIVAINIFNWKFSKVSMIAQEFNDVDINVKGNLCDVPYKMNGKFYYVIDTDVLTSSDELEHVKIKISSPETLDADVFDEVSCTVHTFSPDSSGLMSYRTYLFSRGINLTGYVKQESESCVFVTKNVNRSPYSFLLRARMSISSAIRNLLPNELSSVATGMLLGDKYMVDESVKENFRDLGVSHLLAVSGLHTAVVAKLLQIIFSMFGFRKKLTSILSCVGIFVFMGITGFSPSVMRAGIVALLFFLGDVFNRKPDSLNSLGFAVFIILIIDPFAAGDVSMLLSFLATLGIILFEKPIRSHIKLPRFIASTFSVTTSATILTLPLIMISFGKISLLSVVANLLLVIPSMIMIPFILLSTVFYFCKTVSFLSYPLAFVAGIIIKYIILCSEFLAKIPFASINISQPHLTLWLVFSFFLFAVAILFQRSNRNVIKTTTLLSLIMFLVSVLSNQIATRNLTSIAILDSDNGCTTVLTKNGHAAILTCGGSKYKLKNVINYLERQNIRSIDLMTVPSYSNECSFYSDEILSTYDISTLLLYENEKLDEKITNSLIPKNCTYHFKDSVTVNLWENVKIDVVSQNNKTFIFLNINNITTLICPSGGDTSMLGDGLFNCDFFITSKSPDNLAKICPVYSVLSSDKNKLIKDLPKFSHYKNVPFMTSEYGNIIIDFISENKVSIHK